MSKNLFFLLSNTMMQQVLRIHRQLPFQMHQLGKSPKQELSSQKKWIHLTLLPSMDFHWAWIPAQIFPPPSLLLNLLLFPRHWKIDTRCKNKKEPYFSKSPTVELPHNATLCGELVCQMSLNIKKCVLQNWLGLIHN